MHLLVYVEDSESESIDADKDEKIHEHGETSVHTAVTPDLPRPKRQFVGGVDEVSSAYSSVERVLAGATPTRGKENNASPRGMPGIDGGSEPRSRLAQSLLGGSGQLAAKRQTALSFNGQVDIRPSDSVSQVGSESTGASKKSKPSYAAKGRPKKQPLAETDEIKFKKARTALTDVVAARVKQIDCCAEKGAKKGLKQEMALIKAKLDKSCIDPNQIGMITYTAMRKTPRTY